MIRLISILAVFGLLLAAPAAFAAEPGDVNGDGVVDKTDASIAADAVGAGDDGYIAAADMDGDGAISLADVSKILEAAN